MRSTENSSTSGCNVCAPFLKMADAAERLAEMPDHEYSSADAFDKLEERARQLRSVLENHGSALSETLRPFPVRNSLPRFVETFRHYGDVSFELDFRPDHAAFESWQVQLWAPLWVKVVTDYYSDQTFDCGASEMACALEVCRDAILLRGLTEDAELARAIDSAYRLGGREAAILVVPGDYSHPLDFANDPRRADLLREARRRRTPLTEPG